MRVDYGSIGGNRMIVNIINSNLANQATHKETVKDIIRQLKERRYLHLKISGTSILSSDEFDNTTKWINSPINTSINGRGPI